MYIAGDLASGKEKIEFSNFDIQEDEFFLINLEGGIIPDSKKDECIRKDMVFNSSKIINYLNSEYNILLGLSNNHIFDDMKVAENTFKFIEKNNIRATGIKYGNINLTEPIRIKENGISVSIITAGWDVIGCVNKRKFYVNQLDENKILCQIKKEKQISDNVILYLHWGYELEIYPHPADRSLAKKSIDMGADLVVGCHSHCMMGYEKYKNSFIFYGLGNFFFDENYFMNGKIKFPDISKVGILLRFSPKDKNLEYSFIKKDLDDIQKVFFDNSKEHFIILEKLSKPFSLPDGEYIDFFKKK